MNTKKLTVAALLAIALVAFLLGAYQYQRGVQNAQME